MTAGGVMPDIDEIERHRCLNIVRAASRGEVDCDLQSIISMIDSGRTVQQIKQLFHRWQEPREA